ncbi:hypothetical protein [Rhizobium sp.]|uniref:hypothetical protein n=1 Tax=Rhizobium sp. TaxID=391 RepID=UPI003F81D75D
MSKIQIICTQPGIRRNGMQHPAEAIYDKARWSEKELEAFRADRAFVVLEVGSDGVKATDEAIDAEVQRLVGLKIVDLQAGFDKAVKDAAAELADDIGVKLRTALERVQELEGQLSTANSKADNTIDDLGKKLAAAGDTIADLQKQLEAATAGQSNEAGKPAAKK